MKRFYLIALTVCSLACSKPYRQVNFELKSDPSATARFASDHIELAVGTAVQVHVTPIRRHKGYSKDAHLDLFAVDGEVLGVFDSTGRRNFVFVGLRAGETCVSVYLQGQERECIPVKID